MKLTTDMYIIWKLQSNDKFYDHDKFARTIK